MKRWQLLFPTALCALLSAWFVSRPAGADLPVSGNYTVVYNDEFNGTSLDTNNWGYNYPWGTYHNGMANMQQSQVTVGGGLLTLKAENFRSITNPWGIQTADFGWLNLDYTSGTIHSQGKREFKYGYMEGRFKMPWQVSTWPAFWMLQNGWPPELDIFEVQGDRGRAYYNYHYTNGSGNHASWGGQYGGAGDLSAGWHTFAFEWTPSTLKYFVDGNYISGTSAAEIAQMNTMYFLIDLQVGGWAPAPTAAEYPATMQCDWVRVWQKDVGLANGTYRLTPQNAPTQALEVGGWNTNNGATVNIFPYSAGANAQWILTRQSNGSYVVRSNMTWVNRVLDLTNGTASDGNYLEIWDNNANAAQQWHFVPVGGGWYKVLAQNDLSKGLSLPGSSSTAGTKAWLWEHLGNADQLWKLTPISDDVFVQFGASSYSVSENGGTATITVTRTGKTSSAVSINYAAANGSATKPGDYGATSGTLNFGANETSKTFTVPIMNDSTYEPDETINLTLTSPGVPVIASAPTTATLTIVNDDAPPRSLSISDVTVTEGNTGTTTDATFTVTLSNTASQDVTVDYATADATATAPGDYAVTGGKLTFAPGETSKTITVPVKGDALNETNETLKVLLSNSGGAIAAISDGLGVGTITNDDAVPSLSINDVSVPEGNAGTVSAVFPISLAAASGRTVSVAYATGDDTATASADYAATKGTLTFAPGETSKIVSVSIKGDTLNEDSETFKVTLSGATNTTLADNVGVGTIVNDDGTPGLRISDALAVPEGPAQGAPAGSKNATFTVTLSAASSRTVTVNYATANGTALEGADYSATRGALTFTPGQTSKTITVLVLGDSLDEVDETFKVNLSGAVNATVSRSPGVGTITDDDGTPALSINDVARNEGNNGAILFTFTVTLSTISGRTVTVNYATADATATAGSDYVAKSGMLSFAPGETSKTIAVAVNGDTLAEPNETFAVRLSLSLTSGASLADGQGVGMIINDDALAASF